METKLLLARGRPPEPALAIGDKAVHRDAHRVDQHGFKLIAPQRRGGFGLAPRGPALPIPRRRDAAQPPGHAAPPGGQDAANQRGRTHRRRLLASMSRTRAIATRARIITVRSRKAVPPTERSSD